MNIAAFSDFYTIKTYKKRLFRYKHSNVIQYLKKQEDKRFVMEKNHEIML